MLASEQQAVPVAKSTRGEPPRAIDKSAASAAGAVTRSTDEPELELILSGDSDASYDSKAAPPSSGSSGANTVRDRLIGSGKHGGIMSEIFE
uniref:Uncharacterized protein n=1 Tax=Peronospora matthiolae TaxID=2874970 RepID=A0AAV1U8T4_9STRA